MWTDDKRGNYAVRDRKQRVGQVINALAVADKSKVEVSYKKFKAELSLKFGLSSRKIQEYVKDLYDAEKVDIYTNDDGEECIRLRIQI